MSGSPENRINFVKNQGDEEVMTIDVQPDHELIYGSIATYLGRINFGKGNIEATHVKQEDFTKNLQLIAGNYLIYAPDYRQINGVCMDGRNFLMTEAKTKPDPRPKVIGGPSLFTPIVASIASFSILKGIDDPIEQFYTINQELIKANFGIGMHRECGMARGAKSVVETLVESFDDVNRFLGSRAKFVATKQPHLLDMIKAGAESTFMMLNKTSSFTEDKMIDVVKELAGDEAAMHLDVDHDHDNHGHDEQGLILVDSENTLVLKDKFNQDTDIMNFWQNVRYGRSLLQVVSRNQEEYLRGVIVADQLALAGTGTLGRNQHVGEISSEFLS